MELILETPRLLLRRQVPADPQKVAEKIGMSFERRVEDGENTPFFIYSIERPGSE